MGSSFRRRGEVQQAATAGPPVCRGFRLLAGFSIVELPALAKKGTFRVRVAGEVDTREVPLKVKRAKRRASAPPPPRYQD
jgi:hypothetical protein